MLRTAFQCATSLATKLQGSSAPVALSAGRAIRFAADKAGSPKPPADDDIETRDVYAFLAKQMQSEAGKQQQSLKQDVLKVIDLLEDASPDPEAPYEGKLKDALKFMGKRTRNELFKTLMKEEEMQNMHPALKSVINKLSEVGESSHIVDVVYKYMELVEGKTASAGGTAVEMVLASEEGAGEVEQKKAMLLHDMIAKGMMKSGDKVTWNIRVDPQIEGGVVYRLGDLLLDCSVKSLKDEFYNSLASAGIQRVE